MGGIGDAAALAWRDARAVRPLPRRARRRFDAHPQRGHRADRRRGRPRRRGRRGDRGRHARRGRLRGEPPLARRARSTGVPVGAFARVLARIEPTPGRARADRRRPRARRTRRRRLGRLPRDPRHGRRRARRGRLAREPARRPTTARCPGPSTARSWMPRARPPLCASGPKPRACRSRGRSRSATARTTCG